MHAIDPRSKRLRFSSILIASLLAIVIAATGCQRELGGRSQVLINEARAQHGLPALAWDDQAAAKAQAWAERLASQGRLEHSRLTDGMTGWNALGENVGYSGTIEGVHQLFMNSTRHRNTMLSRAYNAVGVGVAVRDGQYWIVQVYRG